MQVDRYIRFDAYERTGVREYWLIDPRMRFVEIYTLAASGEFGLLGQFRAEEQVHSQVLDGFTPRGEKFIYLAYFFCILHDLIRSTFMVLLFRVGVLGLSDMHSYGIVLWARGHCLTTRVCFRAEEPKR